MKRLLVWITNTRLWSWLLLRVVPFIRFSVYYTDFRGKQYHAGYMKLRTGDIILTKDKRKMTTLLVGGEFTHAALCVGTTITDYQVAEMTHTNFTKSYFFDICKESDRVVILRCKDWDSSYIQKVIAKCKSFEGTPYDVAFEMGIKALACSELIWYSDEESRLQVDCSDYLNLGVEFVSPTDLYEAKNIDIIWDSDEKKKI